MNPADQPYTVSTAFVIEGLLDALTVEDALNENRRVAVKRRVRTVIDHYLTQVFTTLTDDTGYFPYSTNPNDNYFTPNVSSAFVGVAARYFDAFPGDIERPDFYRKRLKAAMTGLLDEVEYSNRAPFGDTSHCPIALATTSRMTSSTTPSSCGASAHTKHPLES